MTGEPLIEARTRAAMREAIRYHLYDPNVGMVDFGYRQRKGQIRTNEPLAIRIHVKNKYATDDTLAAAVAIGFTRPIPRSIGGVPIDVCEGVYRPHQWPWWSSWWAPPPPPDPRATRLDPMSGGISISDEGRNVYATLGGKVIDQVTGAEMILSNWHVLVGDWSARPGQSIYQPGRLDGGTSVDTVATLTRDAMSVNLDAAVATLTGSRQLRNDQLDLGPVTGVSQARLGMEVEKSGRRTGITHGFVTGLEGVAKITYGTVDRLIQSVLTIDPRRNYEQVSDAGDSGSLWCDSATLEVVGLHFAGSSAPSERGLALDIRAVLNALNVELVVLPQAAARPQVERGPAAPSRARRHPAAPTVSRPTTEPAFVSQGVAPETAEVVRP